MLPSPLESSLLKSASFAAVEPELSALERPPDEPVPLSEEPLVPEPLVEDPPALLPPLVPAPLVEDPELPLVPEPEVLLPVWAIASPPAVVSAARARSVVLSLIMARTTS